MRGDAGLLLPGPLLFHTKFFYSHFAEVNSPHKSIILSFTIADIKNVLADLCGN